MRSESTGAGRSARGTAHRFEFNNQYRTMLEEGGLVISGVSPEGGLVEVIELPHHPWFVACQFHPELKSRPTRPAPPVRLLHCRGEDIREHSAGRSSRGSRRGGGRLTRVPCSVASRSSPDPAYSKTTR